MLDLVWRTRNNEGKGQYGHQPAPANDWTLSIEIASTLLAFQTNLPYPCSEMIYEIILISVYFTCNFLIVILRRLAVLYVKNQEGSLAFSSLSLFILTAHYPLSDVYIEPTYIPVDRILTVRSLNGGYEPTGTRRVTILYPHTAHTLYTYYAWEVEETIVKVLKRCSTYILCM